MQKFHKKLWWEENFTNFWNFLLRLFWVFDPKSIWGGPGKKVVQSSMKKGLHFCSVQRHQELQELLLEISSKRLWRQNFSKSIKTLIFCFFLYKNKCSTKTWLCPCFKKLNFMAPFYKLGLNCLKAIATGSLLVTT